MHRCDGRSPETTREAGPAGVGRGARAARRVRRPAHPGQLHGLGREELRRRSCESRRRSRRRQPLQTRARSATAAYNARSSRPIKFSRVQEDQQRSQPRSRDPCPTPARHTPASANDRASETSRYRLTDRPDRRRASQTPVAVYGVAALRLLGRQRRHAARQLDRELGPALAATSATACASARSRRGRRRRDGPRSTPSASMPLHDLAAERRCARS